MSRYEYLAAVIAFDPDRVHVWVRQGDAEVMGHTPGPDALTFGSWNALLNRLGAAGWEVANVTAFEDQNGDQSWLFKREL